MPGEIVLGMESVGGMAYLIGLISALIALGPIYFARLPVSAGITGRIPAWRLLGLGVTKWSI